jgi:hypothetical protein
LEHGISRWLIAGCVLVTLVATGMGAPSQSLAQGEQEYSTTFEPECVLGPGSLNTKFKAKAAIKGVGPTSVELLEEYSVRNASLTLTAPAEVTESLANRGVAEVRGQMTRFLLDGPEANLNIAKPMEFQGGLPFVSGVERGSETALHLPSLTLGETGHVYTFGPWKIGYGNPASGSLSLNSAAGFTETAPGEYAATGQGIVVDIEGFDALGEASFGPVVVACNPPSKVAFAQIEHIYGLETGHPEIFSNGIRNSSKSPAGLEASGALKLSVPALSAEIECINVGWGPAWNEGSPSLAHAKVMGWFASGNGTTAGTALSRQCKFKQGTLEGAEAWITSEPALAEGKRSGPLSLPWNADLGCYEGEATLHSLAIIGIPNGATPVIGCKKSEAEQQAAIEQEEQTRVGCYATTVPEGCVKVDVVVPSAAEELVLAGTVVAKWQNGFGNGLHPSNLAFIEDPSAQLHLAGSYSTAAKVSGGLRVSGALIQAIRAV